MGDLFKKAAEEKSAVLELLASMPEVEVGKISVKRDLSVSTRTEPVLVKRKDFFQAYSDCTPSVKAAACRLIELNSHKDGSSIRVWHRFQSRCLSSVVDGRPNPHGPAVLAVALERGLVPAFDVLQGVELPILETRVGPPEEGWFLLKQAGPFKRGTAIKGEILRLLPAEVEQARKVPVRIPDMPGFRWVDSHLSDCEIGRSTGSAFLRCRAKFARFTDTEGALFVGGTLKHAIFHGNVEDCVIIGSDIRQTRWEGTNGTPAFRQCRVIGMTGLPEGRVGELVEFSDPALGLHLESEAV